MQPGYEPSSAVSSARRVTQSDRLVGANMVVTYVLGAGAGGLLCFVVLWPAYGLIVALSYWPIVSALTALLGLVVSCGSRGACTSRGNDVGLISRSRWDSIGAQVRQGGRCPTCAALALIFRGIRVPLFGARRAGE